MKPNHSEADDIMNDQMTVVLPKFKEKDPIVIFLSGPGGVGKTTVGLKLQEILTNAGVSAQIVVSSTRSTYARMKVATETEARNLPVKDLTTLQTEIFKDYCTNILTHLTQAVKTGEVQVMIIDRTPYDHSSYFFQQIPSLTLVDIRERLALVKRFMEEINSIVRNSKHIVFFPYPRPWTTPEGSADGQRANLDAKTYIWSLAMSEMTKLEHNKEHFYLWITDDVYRSIEGTAMHILELVANHENRAATSLD